MHNHFGNCKAQDKYVFVTMNEVYAKNFYGIQKLFHPKLSLWDLNPIASPSFVSKSGLSCPHSSISLSELPFRL